VIELWGRKNAYNVQKVLWALAELGLKFAHHDVGSSPGDLETEEFLSINPHARIPVVVDEGNPVWESNTIVRYLCAKHGPGKLWLADPLERTFADRWMDWELAALQPDFIDLFWAYYRTPASERDHEKIENAKQRCEAHFRKLDAWLKARPFVAGGHFSMGDIACGVSVYRYFEMGLSAERPENVLKWFERLSRRSSFSSIVMVEFSELKGRRTF
jgi:glutathione S-transferase